MKRILVIAIASLFLFTGCTTDKNTIIKINNQPIKKSQFDAEFKKTASEGMLAKMGIEIPQNDDSFIYLMLKDRIVNDLIVKTLVEQELNKKHIKITKNDVNNELKNKIDMIGSKEQFNEILKRNGISNEQFMQELKQELKVKKLISMIENVKISDHEAEVFYKKNQDKFVYPEKVRASHILIEANPLTIENEIRSKGDNYTLSETIIKEKVSNEMNARLEKAKAIETSIKNLPDEFEKIAREKSDDIASAKNGGDLGFFAKTDMVEPFAKQAFSQQPNTISPVIQTQFGYHIIKVTDRMEAGKEPFIKVKEQIKLYLQTQKQMTILENIIIQLKSNAKIEYIDNSYNPQVIQNKLKELTKKKQQNTVTSTPEPQKK